MGNVFLSLRFPTSLLGLIAAKLHTNMPLNPDFCWPLWFHPDFFFWLGFHAGPGAHTVLHMGKLPNKSQGSWAPCINGGFLHISSTWCKMHWGTDFLWVIVQFYAFARTEVFNKSDLWSPWSIFLSTTDLNILYGLWSFVFLIFWLVFSLLGGVGCRCIIPAWVEFSTQSNFIALQCSQRPERDMSANLTNFIDRLRILSVGQIMGVIHILQAPPLISPGSDAGLVWITFSSLLIRVLESWSMQGPIPHGTQMLSLISSTYSQGQ